MDVASRNQRLREALEGMGLFVEPIFCGSDQQRIDYMLVSVALPSYVTEAGGQEPTSGTVAAPVAGTQVREIVRSTEPQGDNVVKMPAKL